MCACRSHGAAPHSRLGAHGHLDSCRGPCTACAHAGHVGLHHTRLSRSVWPTWTAAYSRLAGGRPHPEACGCPLPDAAVKRTCMQHAAAALVVDRMHQWPLPCLTQSPAQHSTRHVHCRHGAPVLDLCIHHQCKLVRTPQVHTLPAGNPHPQILYQIAKSGP